MNQVTSGGVRARIAVLTNIVAPYRVPIYQELGQRFGVSVFYSGHEGNRAAWHHATPPSSGIVIKRSAGWTIARPRIQAGRRIDTRHLHLTPGFFLDLVRLRPHAIISNEMGFRSLVALIYGAMFRIPCWVWWGGTVHTERDIGPLRRSLRGLFARVTRRWFSYGSSSTAYLASLGVPRTRIVELQNCIAETDYVAGPEPLFHVEPRPVLLHVGQLIGRKGIDLLLEACGLLQARGRTFSLVLVGEGPDRTRLQARVEQLGLRHVHFYGSVPPSQMPAVYRSADALVFPTMEDVWGLVVNEALWSGTPVLCSRYAGCAAEVLPPPNVFDPLDAAEFDARLDDLIEGRLGPADPSRLKRVHEVAAIAAAEIVGALGGWP